MSFDPNWKNDVDLDREATNNNIYKHGSPSHSFIDVELLTNFSKNHCAKQYEQMTRTFFELYEQGFCEVTFDGLSCWPPTALNQTAVHKCFSELNHVKYDDTSE